MGHVLKLNNTDQRPTDHQVAYPPPPHPTSFHECPSLSNTEDTVPLELEMFAFYLS